MGNSTAVLEVNLVDAFRDGLRELGYEEGRNLVIEYRWAEGDYERFPALVAELIAAKVDVIVTAGTPAALAVKKATSPKSKGLRKLKTQAVSRQTRVLQHNRGESGHPTFTAPGAALKNNCCDTLISVTRVNSVADLTSAYAGEIACCREAASLDFKLLRLDVVLV